MVRKGVYCTTSRLSIKAVTINLSVILGGGSEPSCCWGAWRGQDQSSKVNLEKFQSSLEASEYKTSQKCKQDLILLLDFALVKKTIIWMEIESG